MDFSNHTTYNSNIHYEANKPKLQWLLILIPVAAIFALYTAYRIRNKRKRRKQLLEEASAAFPASGASMRRNTLASIDPHNTNSSNISLVRLPQSGDVYVSVQAAAAEERTIHQQQAGSTGSSSRRESTSPVVVVITAPPPTYSVCSPPKYEDVVHLRTKDDDDNP